MSLFLPSLFVFLLLKTAEGVLEGKFTTDQGSSCEWREEVYGETSISFLLECWCTSPSDGKLFQYSCEYEGNPHKCEYYDIRGGAPRFFHQIADHFKSEGSNVHERRRQFIGLFNIYIYNPVQWDQILAVFISLQNSHMAAL